MHFLQDDMAPTGPKARHQLTVLSDVMEESILIQRQSLLDGVTFHETLRQAREVSFTLL